MRSSASLAFLVAAGAILALSLGLKVALAFPGARSAAHAPAARQAALHRFLAANAVGPMEPVATGWRFHQGGCSYLAFPSGPRGTMDMTALGRAGPGDRVGYVYRGQITAKPPTAAYAVAILTYLATKPFRPAPEPSYVVVVAKTCQTLPALPWRDLAT